MQMVKIMTWNDFINEENKKSYFQNLQIKLKEEYQNYICYPEYSKIYEAFRLTPLDEVKVVILGQDPYHEPNQAHGLAFSVLCEKLPPSLKNIYKEMASDLNCAVSQDGNLEYLARQGVLLLNATLSVREHLANSHKDLGWQTFTDNVLKYLATLDRPLVFILWGSYAQTKKNYITNPKHLVITSAHPSPLSAYRGFFGSRCFSRCNTFLISNDLNPIHWVKEVV